ncbi:MAG: RecQ family ATP-dependent DNA helicase, partial [Flavobacteriales bacterium]
DALKANGIKAAYFNSSLSSSEETEVRSLAESGQLKFLYIAPERLIGLYQGWLSNLDVNLVAIDEAHCVSMWGHDFRPEYTQLRAVREHWNSIPFIALTATADKVTRNDIIEQLGLRSTQVSISSFDRSNLSLATRGGVPQKQKFKEIADFVQYRPNQSGIIYCLSRKDTENLANYLQGSGIQAAAYHAGLDSALRSKIQDSFIKEKIPIVVATIAFGMGIDKSNVRFVIHSSLPKNIEGYYQEIGRAGRDGMPSDTLMYYNWKDFILLKRFADESAHQELNLEKLQRIFDYGEAVNCRRQTILSYFGEEHGGNCGNCDNCLRPAELFDGTILAQKALSAAYRVEQKVAANMMIAILRGSAPAELIAKGYHEIKTYGVGRDLSFRDWKHYLVQMINQGIFEVAYKDAFSLKISKLGAKVLKGQHQVKLSKFKESLNTDGTDVSRKKKAKWEAIFEQLKALRTELAERLDVLPHNIFNDATLKEISIVKPRTRHQLERISGVSSHKADIYGDSFLSVFTSRKKKKGIGNSTYMRTFGLWKNGMSPEEIAKERGVQSTTIYSH